MRKTVACALCCALGAASSSALGAFTSIGAFTGAASEGFESFAFGPPPGTGNIMDPYLFLDGAAYLSGTHVASYAPIYIWGSTGGLSLGDVGSAVPYDGIKGMTLQSSQTLGDPTARIDFLTPTTQFGGYWAHATWLGSAGPISITFFDAGGGVMYTEDFDFADSTGGIMNWYGWESTVAFSAIEFTGFWATLDGIQINTPTPGVLMPMGLAAMCMRRRR